MIQKKKCKVCGCDYVVCPTAHKNTKTYRWQDVACCEEHGAQYLREIMASRGMIAADSTADTARVEESLPVTTAVDQSDIADDTDVADKSELAADRKNKRKRKPEVQA